MKLISLGPPQPSTATLTVSKHVTCNFTSGCPTADKFTIIASTNNGTSISFPSSESGPSLTLTQPFPVTYNVIENNPKAGVVIATIPVGLGPVGVAFNPNNGDMYVVNSASKTVSVIDRQQIVL